jgi:nucleoside 2-deoxyribosyltransferase
MKIYVASSWRNTFQPRVVAALREAGFDVYDFRNPGPGNEGFHWSEIDRNYKGWTPETFRKALEHPIAEAGFSLDMNALRTCDACVLVLPCGKSAHLEAGYAIGTGKPTVIFLSDKGVPGGAETELMYKMTPHICLDMGEVIQTLTFLANRVEAV